MATKEFLKDYFPKYKQIEIYSYESINNMTLIKKIVNKNDIIIINGGGYFGLYKMVIEGEANIVKSFPNNHIIFFPCSILYNSQNFKEYNKYIDIFNEHQNLTLFTRDNTSYNIALKIFKNITIYNSPDLVTRLNLKFLGKKKKRDGIMLILRKDELLLNDDNRKYIKDLAIKYFGNKVFVRDTNKFLIPFQSNRKNETFKFINDISGKKLIITDRLHGMIFSIITNTPCIIFGNNYHKIESSYYSWFKNVEYAIFIDKNEIGIKLETSINKLMNLENFKKYDNRIFNKYYLLLKKIIQEKINLII
jgi:pyruvyl transferase EpsI